MTTRLDISIGPVQGFVSQSRRTRDLWGSSYLLSFLSAHAMRGARDAGGRIDQPMVDDDPLFQWVTGRGDGEAPRIGSAPNHFVVLVNGDAVSVARAAVGALDDAWKRVCRAVWGGFVAHAVSAGDGTERIWNRQVETFWAVTWAAGPSENGGELLARRKHWRSNRPPDEPGDKCTVMHDFQELSGHVRAESRASREQQDEFWKRVRGPLGTLDLEDNERLCAIALVKRLFPRVAPQALGWEVDTSHWPSTVYVGAVPWIRRVAAAAPERAREYAEAVRQNAGPGVLAERRPPFARLDIEAAGNFAKLDANYFHREFLESERRCPLTDHATDEARDRLDRLLTGIGETREDGRPLGTPPTFYALLLADGDRLGRLVGELGGQPVSRALSTFTGRVREIVREHDGVTVYAGGDDVMAMLPAPAALACADSLAVAYRSAFGGRPGATLSAAVTYAHVRLPLGSVLHEAHRLLDDVAKDGNGRDSLAAAVLKPGALHCQWTTTWDRTRPGGDPVSAVKLLGDLIGHLADRETEPGLSAALIYRTRETLAMLCGWDRWRPGDWGSAPGEVDLRQFLRAEIVHSLAVRMDGGAEVRADELTDLVWRVLGPSRARGDGAETPDDAILSDNVTEAGIDALLLARFLAGHRDAGDGR